MNYVYIFFSKAKNTFRGTLAWNLLQNFNDNKLIIQGRNMYIIFFDILAYIYGW